MASHTPCCAPSGRPRGRCDPVRARAAGTSAWSRLLPAEPAAATWCSTSSSRAARVLVNTRERSSAPRGRKSALQQPGGRTHQVLMSSSPRRRRVLVGCDPPRAARGTASSLAARVRSPNQRHVVLDGRHHGRTGASSSPLARGSHVACHARAVSSARRYRGLMQTSAESRVRSMATSSHTDVVYGQGRRGRFT